jgi:DNA-binding transcriptional MerR regulator
MQTGDLAMDDIEKSKMNPEPPGQERCAEEISKKDLLHKTGISYGQFYRWKRMGLIPEAWFRRRSTFTGQEAFLPRQKVLDRIAHIQELKDRLSLDEIGEMLSPDAVRRTYMLSEVRAMGIFQLCALEILTSGQEREELRYPHLLALMLIQCLLATSLGEDTIRQAVETLLERFDDIHDDTAEKFLVLAVHDGVTISALHTGACLFDGSTEVVASVNLNVLVEELNLWLRDSEAS